MRLSHDAGLAEPFMPGHVGSCYETYLSVNDLDCVPSLFESAVRGRRCMNGAGRWCCSGQRDGFRALHVKVASRQCCCQRIGCKHYRQFQHLTTFLGALLVA